MHSCRFEAWYDSSGSINHMACCSLQGRKNPTGARAMLSLRIWESCRCFPRTPTYPIFPLLPFVLTVFCCPSFSVFFCIFRSFRAFSEAATLSPFLEQSFPSHSPCQLCVFSLSLATSDEVAFRTGIRKASMKNPQSF